MADVTPNDAYTVPIDATGVVLTIPLVARGQQLQYYRLVELSIVGTAPASYRVEFGSRDADTGERVWFEIPGYSYGPTTDEHHEWFQSREFLRIRVTNAATTAGATAKIVVSEAR